MGEATSHCITDVVPISTTEREPLLLFPSTYETSCSCCERCPLWTSKQRKRITVLFPAERKRELPIFGVLGGVFWGSPLLPPFWYWQPQSWEMLITKKHASVSACKEECSVWRNSWERTSSTKEASKPHVATQPSSITGKKREESVTAKTANCQSSSQQYERLRRS